MFRRSVITRKVRAEIILCENFLEKLDDIPCEEASRGWESGERRERKSTKQAKWYCAFRHGTYIDWPERISHRSNIPIRLTQQTTSFPSIYSHNGRFETNRKSYTIGIFERAVHAANVNTWNKKGKCNVGAFRVELELIKGWR